MRHFVHRCEQCDSAGSTRADGAQRQVSDWFSCFAQRTSTRNCVPSRLPSRIAVDSRQKAMPSPSSPWMIDTLDSRNVAHPCAPARGPWRSPGTASTTASGRAPVEAPQARTRQGSWIHIAGGVGRPLRGEWCDRSPREGSPGHRCPISLLHSGSLHNAITASSSTRSSARYERASAKGQPHSAADTRRHTRRAN